MSTPHTPQPSTLPDDLEQFFVKQRARIRRGLTVRVQRIERARQAARSEDVMSDALVITRRGFTFGGSASDREG